VDRFVTTAASIGARLAKQADWSNGECTWSVATLDRAHVGERRVLRTAAGPFLYQGTAGIALFLSELYRATGDVEALRAARGGIAHALRLGQQLRPSAFGFHAGRVGISYAAAQLALTTGEEHFAAAAASMLRPLFGRESEDRGLDVVGGAAGAIPVLLLLADHLALPEARNCAVALGEHLLLRATRNPGGWSWASEGQHHVRHLAGLAHGAAGFGYGLLELWAATGDDAYKYAAGQAFAYESTAFDPDDRNWADFRHAKLAEMLSEPAQRSELAAALRAGHAPPQWRNSSMAAWCHGAPGIGLTRLRAFDLLGSDAHKRQALDAIHTTLARIDAASPTFSLCHGIFGNCETLLQGAAVLRETTWREVAETIAAEAADRFERHGNAWPSGAIDGVPDPSLLLGDAGIGYHLLRLAEPATPCVLLPTVSATTHTQPRIGSTRSIETQLPSRLDILRDRDVDAFLFSTRRVVRRLLPDYIERLGVTGPSNVPIETSPVMAAFDATMELIDRLGSGTEAGMWVADAFGPEQARLESAMTIDNLLEGVLEGLAAIPLDNSLGDHLVVRLSQHTRLISCLWDWDAWLADPMLQKPVAGPVSFVVYRRENVARLQRIGRFAAEVLAAVCVPKTVDQVVVRLANKLGWPDDDGDRVRHDELLGPVVKQLQEAQRAGMVVVESPASCQTPCT
jgi:hypothetical protein